MGSVIKNGENWVAIYNWYDPDKGEKRRRWKRGFKRKKDAQEYVMEMESFNNNKSINTEIRFDDYCDYWISNHAKAKCQESTLEAYLPRINKYFKPYFKNMKLKDITSHHVRNYYQILQCNSQLSSRTIHHHHRLLHNIFERAVYWEYISKNPVLSDDHPTVDEKEQALWDENDVKKAINIIDNNISNGKLEIIELVILIAIYGGMRRGEICGLKYSDVNDKEKTIDIKRAIGRKNGAWDVKSTKTKSSIRQVVVPESVIRIIRLYEQEQKRQNVINDEDYICSMRDGKLMKPQYVSKKAKKFIIENGLKEIPLKNLRHTNATLLSKIGVPHKCIQDRLGHSSVLTTENNYIQSQIATQRDAMNRFEEHLSYN